MTRLLKHPRLPFALTAIAGIGLVAGAVVFAKLANLSACPLCILQRMIYLLLSAVGIVGLLVTQPLLRRLVALVMVAVAGCGVFTAAYLVWIQRFAQDTNCSAAMPWWERLVDWAGERMPTLFGASGLCSERAVALFGVSFAEWSLIAFVGLFAVAVFGALRRS